MTTPAIDIFSTPSSSNRYAESSTGDVLQQQEFPLNFCHRVYISQDWLGVEYVSNVIRNHSEADEK